MNDLTNEVEIRLIAMRRSGSHAFLNWTCSIFDGPVCFLNDATRHLPSSKHQMSDELPTISEARRTSLNAPKRLLIYNLEDVRPVRYAGWWLPQTLVGTSALKVTILLLRDPFNLFASRMKAGENLPHEPFALKLFPKEQSAALRLRSLWIAHAREFLRRTQHFTGDFFAVSYNNWVASPGYRAELADKLGGKDSDMTLRQVTKYGFGSSFEGPGKRELANRLGLLHRWRHFASNSEYREFLNDKCLIKLSQEIFGQVCEFN